MAGPSHSPELHSERLNLLCRICGGRVGSKRKRSDIRKCSAYDSLIERLFGISISEEVNGTAFSKCLCTKCSGRLSHMKNRDNGSPSAAVLQKVVDQIEHSKGIWKSFDAALDVSKCTVCSLFKTRKPPKNEEVGDIAATCPAQTVNETQSQCSTDVRRRLSYTLKARQAEKQQEDSTVSSLSDSLSSICSPSSATTGLSPPAQVLRLYSQTLNYLKFNLSVISLRNETSV